MLVRDIHSQAPCVCSRVSQCLRMTLAACAHGQTTLGTLNDVFWPQWGFLVPSIPSAMLSLVRTGVSVFRLWGNWRGLLRLIFPKYISHKQFVFISVIATVFTEKWPLGYLCLLKAHLTLENQVQSQRPLWNHSDGRFHSLHCTLGFPHSANAYHKHLPISSGPESWEVVLLGPWELLSWVSRVFLIGKISQLTPGLGHLQRKFLCGFLALGVFGSRSQLLTDSCPQEKPWLCPEKVGVYMDYCHG